MAGACCDFASPCASTFAFLGAGVGSKVSSPKGISGLTFDAARELSDVAQKKVAATRKLLPVKDQRLFLDSTPHLTKIVSLDVTSDGKLGPYVCDKIDPCRLVGGCQATDVEKVDVQTLFRIVHSRFVVG